MIERLDIIEKKYEDIQAELSDPAVFSDVKKTSSLSKKTTISEYKKEYITQDMICK